MEKQTNNQELNTLNYEEYEKLMVETFPKLYSRRSDLHAYSMFGFETPHGWNKLVYDLSWMIDDYCKTNNIEYPYINQVKSKYGSLRYYYDGGDDYIDILVSDFEDKSYKTCEYCGSEENVTSNDRGWIETLCENCWNKKKEVK